MFYTISFLFFPVRQISQPNRVRSAAGGPRLSPLFSNSNEQLMHSARADPISVEIEIFWYNYLSTSHFFSLFIEIVLHNNRFSSPAEPRRSRLSINQSINQPLEWARRVGVFKGLPPCANAGLPRARVPENMRALPLLAERVSGRDGRCRPEAHGGIREKGQKGTIFRENQTTFDGKDERSWDLRLRFNKVWKLAEGLAILGSINKLASAGGMVLMCDTVVPTKMKKRIHSEMWRDA
jgi:hypothetical protein